MRPSPAAYAALACLLSPAAIPVSGQAPPPLLRLTPELRVSDDGLSRISTVQLGPSGTLLVGQPDDPAIAVLSATGKILRKLGRRGSGSGDIRSLDAFGVLGDTIWIADNTLHRMTSFDATGRVLRVVPADTAAGSRARTLVSQDSVLAGRYPSAVSHSLLRYLAIEGARLAPR